MKEAYQDLIQFNNSYAKLIEDTAQSYSNLGHKIELMFIESVRGTKSYSTDLIIALTEVFIRLNESGNYPHNKSGQQPEEENELFKRNRDFKDRFISNIMNEAQYLEISQKNIEYFSLLREVLLTIDLFDSEKTIKYFINNLLTRNLEANYYHPSENSEFYGKYLEDLLNVEINEENSDHVLLGRVECLMQSKPEDRVYTMFYDKLDQLAFFDDSLLQNNPFLILTNKSLFDYESFKLFYPRILAARLNPEN